MCNSSGRLVLWMDRELPEKEAAEVEQHVRSCAECASRLDAYQEVSRGFAAYCDAAAGLKARRRIPLWVPVVSSVGVAAALFLVLLVPAITQIPVRPRVAEVPLAAVREDTPRAVKKLHRRHVVAPARMPSTNWALAGPAIQITIPAEAMFPPGAVPEGVNFVADLSIAADGSAQGLRLQP
ncbi:MAG: zf-HC2 domain-containing protein [Terriglobales bacterium]